MAVPNYLNPNAKPWQSGLEQITDLYTPEGINKNIDLTGDSQPDPEPNPNPAVPPSAQMVSNKGGTGGSWFDSILQGGLASAGGIGGGLLDRAIFGSGGLVSTMTGSSTTDPINYANQVQQMADARKYDGFTNAAGHLGFGATSDAERAMGQAGNVYASDINKSNRLQGLGNSMVSNAGATGNAMINSAGITGQNTLNSILSKNPTMNPAAMAGLAGSMNSSIAGSKLDAFSRAGANYQDALKGSSNNTAQAAGILGDSRKNYFSNQVAPYLTNYKAPDTDALRAGLQSGTQQNSQQTSNDNNYTNLLAYATDPLGASAMSNAVTRTMAGQQNDINGNQQNDVDYQKFLEWQNANKKPQGV